MIDQGMMIWHLAGFGLVVMAAMLVANVVLPKAREAYAWCCLA